LLITVGCAEQSGADDVGASGDAPRDIRFSIRQAGANFEVELVRPEGFPEGAYSFSLHIGDQVFKKYRESTKHGIVFTLSEAEFDGLVEGSSIVAHYGPTANTGGGLTFGTFSRGVVGP
jgi:hypothetical protein